MLACLTGPAPGLHHEAALAAAHCMDRAPYVATTLGGHMPARDPAQDFSGPDRSSALYEVGSLVGAGTLALVALFHKGSPHNKLGE